MNGTPQEPNSNAAGEAGRLYRWRERFRSRRYRGAAVSFEPEVQIDSAIVSPQHLRALGSALSLHATLQKKLFEPTRSLELGAIAGSHFVLDLLAHLFALR